MTLTEIGKKYGTDKATHHGYTDFYEEILKGRDIKKMIEIGILQGASLKMWKEYFPFAFILGLDTQPIAVDGCLTIKADADRKEQLLQAVNLTGINRYDLIIDDGGHTMRQQQNAIDALWPFLASGGIYIIEDVHTSKMWEYKHMDDAKTTEQWIDDNFKGSNHARDISPKEIDDVRWWHNDKNAENDSITVAIFKK